MPGKISKNTIDNAKPGGKPYEIRGQHSLVLRVQPSGVKTLYCQVGRGDRRKIGDASVITLARAEYKARELLNEKHDYGKALKRDPVKSTLGGFVDDVYAPWVRANRRRAETCLSDLKRSFEHLYARWMTDLTQDDLDTYVRSRRAHGVANATIVRDLNNLQSVLRQAVSANYLRETPFKGWSKPETGDNGVTRYLTDQEEERLRKALRQRDERMRRERASANKWRAERGYELLAAIPRNGYADHLTPMVLLSLNSGLRFGELSALEWSAVDFRAKVLTAAWNTTKAQKTRHIPLNDEAIEVLTRWGGGKPGSGLVFKNADGSRIKSVKTAWLALLEAAGIGEFRWHDIRHTFGSKLVQRGVALPVVRELLGHSDFKLTLRYAHLKDDQKSEAVARLN